MGTSTAARRRRPYRPPLRVSGRPSVRIPQAFRTLDLVGLSEVQWERWVVRVADLYGWHGIHIRQSEGNVQGVDRADAYGWPDWTFVKPEVGIMFRELKTETGRLSSAQRMWHLWLHEAGADVAVWRPSQWQTVIDTLNRP
jgi:hypothetical protein